MRPRDRSLAGPLMGAALALLILGDGLGRALQGRRGRSPARPLRRGRAARARRAVAPRVASGGRRGARSWRWRSLWAWRCGTRLGPPPAARGRLVGGAGDPAPGPARRASTAGIPVSPAERPELVALIDMGLVLLAATAAWQIVVRRRPVAGVLAVGVGLAYRWTVEPPDRAAVAGALAVAGLAAVLALASWEGGGADRAFGGWAARW